MTKPFRCELEFHPAGERPTEEGDYVLFNSCDGYHIAEAFFDEGEFVCFHFFFAEEVPEDAYCAWAKLPDTTADLAIRFARDRSWLDLPHNGQLKDKAQRLGLINVR